jgi:multiple sugar transport system permease protein
VNKKKNKHKWDKKELKAAYLFTLPSFIGFICFVLIPIIWVIGISFHKYNVFTGASTFAGMENYKKIFADVRSEKYFMVHHMLFTGKYSNRTYSCCAG